MLTFPQGTDGKPDPTVVRLDAPDRGRVLEHFLALDGDARLLRFGMSYSDDAVRRYVQRLDFAGDLLLGWINPFRELAGVVQLARIDDRAVEFSISIARSWRGRGHGQDFTEMALAAAGRHGYGLAHVQFLQCNRPMDAIMDHYAAAHGRDGVEHLVEVPLPAVLARPFRAQLGPFVPSTLAFA